MNPLNSDTQERIRAAFEATLFDVCRLGVATENTSGTYLVETVTWGTTDVACGFTPATPTETHEVGAAQTDYSSGTLRVPVATVVTGIDRVRLTKRFGRTLSPARDFRIDGAPQPGMGTTILTLVAITAAGLG